MSNILQRVNKGMGLITEIMDMLSRVSFGSNYFEIAVTLRESRLLNGILTNADVWYALKKSEIEELEEVDKILLRRILGAPDSTCIESLYLKLGVVPIKVILMARRVMYLHYLVTLNPDQMLYKFFTAQWKKPIKDDWIEEVKKNLNELDIDMTLDDMKLKSNNSFKRIVKINLKLIVFSEMLQIFTFLYCI